MVEANRLETPPYLEGMARIRRGVELDGEGAPVAYHFRAAHPGDALYLRGYEAQDLNRWDRVIDKRRPRCPLCKHLQAKFTEVKSILCKLK